MDYDVLIAGGGPAGAGTAAALVQAGVSPRRILVVDRAGFPRPKPCGGGLTGHALDAMRALGLELAVPYVAATGAHVRCGSLERQVSLPRPVCIVRREAYDASLIEQVQARGVEVRQRVALRGFCVADGRVEAQTDAGVLRARILVGADGAGSLVRKRILRRLPKQRPIRLFRAELPAPPHLRGETAMLYDFSAMRPGVELRGYLWIFPVPGDRINVGLMHDPGRPRSGAELTALLGRELRAHGVALPHAPRGWPAWGYARTARLSAPHLCLVGDAAGIDALTGEGIAVALEQGQAAAAAIRAALGSGDCSLRGYARALHRATVGRELSLDARLARMLYRGHTERWLGLIFQDSAMLDLFAARISGALVLADHRRTLVSALARHLWKGKPVCWS